MARTCVQVWARAVSNAAIGLPVYKVEVEENILCSTSTHLSRVFLLWSFFDLGKSESQGRADKDIHPFRCT